MRPAFPSASFRTFRNANTTNGLVAEVRRAWRSAMIGPERDSVSRYVVAVVALRQPRRVQRRNGSHGPLCLRKALAPLHAALLVVTQGDETQQILAFSRWPGAVAQTVAERLRND